jgi:hypothetical protein
MSAYSDLIIAHGASNYWRLGEGSGTTAVDVIGGANGTISGGVTLAQPGAIADGNKAMTFNGTTGRITAGNIAALNFLAGSYTIEAWVYPLAGGGYFAVVGKGQLTTTTGWRAFIVSSNNLCLFWGNDSSTYATSTLPITTGAWHHLIWGYNATASAVFYAVDGVYESFAAANHSVTSTDVVTISGDASSTYFVNGRIDEVAIYSRALTPAEITAHFKAATGGTRRPDLPFWTLVAGGNPVEQFNRWLPITPSDTLDLPEGPSDGIWVGGGGDVAAVMQDNTMPVVLAAVPAGAWLPIAARRIKATGTTATNLVVLYQL